MTLSMKQLLALILLLWPAFAAVADPQLDSPAPTAAEQPTEVLAQARAALDQTGLADLQIRLEDGVVRISGVVADNAEREAALALLRASVAPLPVQDELSLDPSLAGRIEPAAQRILSLGRQIVDWSPLLLLAALLVWSCLQLGRWLSRSRMVRSLGRGNPYLAELAGQGVRLLSLGVGLLLALELLDLTAMAGALLGAAGVVGIALGFAFKDIIENHLAGILLSLRQPFAPGDHLTIDGHEGKVVGLTTRATLMMTLDGNHLRIPNNKVFNAVILNYTRNPLRRFQFDLGVGAEDDLLVAQRLGVEAMAASGMVSTEREPRAAVEKLGDSSVVVRYSGWVDQRTHDYFAVRSACLIEVKAALEAAGLSLPEPQFRIHLQGQTDRLAEANVRARPVAPSPAPAAMPEGPPLTPDRQVDEDLLAERRQLGDANLLKPQRDE